MRAWSRAWAAGVGGRQTSRDRKREGGREREGGTEGERYIYRKRERERKIQKETDKEITRTLSDIATSMLPALRKRTVARAIERLTVFPQRRRHKLTEDTSRRQFRGLASCFLAAAANDNGGGASTAAQRQSLSSVLGGHSSSSQATTTNTWQNLHHTTRCCFPCALQARHPTPLTRSVMRCLSSSGGSSSSSGAKRKGRKNQHRGGGRSSASGSVAETAEPVLTFNGLSKQLPGGRELFSNANLSFVRGAKVGVLGVNGSGKSTVLKILAGEGETNT